MKSTEEIHATLRSIAWEDSTEQPQNAASDDEGTID